MADADTKTAPQVSIEDAERRHSEHPRQRDDAWLVSDTHPRREPRPPVFEPAQRRRGLDIAVSEAALVRRLAASGSGSGSSAGFAVVGGGV